MDSTLTDEVPMDTSGEGAADTTLTDATVTTDLDQTPTDTNLSKDEGNNLDETQTPLISNTSKSDKVNSKPPSTRSSKRGRPSNSAKTGPTPKRKPRQSAASASRNNSGQLYDIVLEGKCAIQSVVSDWVSRYQRDSEKSMLELIQYFVRCSGCKAVISRKDFQTCEASTVIRVLTENFAEDSGDYPLVTTGVLYKKFKISFSEFVERLISECGESILYDEYMLDTMVVWLVGLSDSQVRAFRHTSTLACLKLVSGLIKVGLCITQEIDNTQRQFDTEIKKAVARRATGKLEKLESKLQESQQQLTELQDMMNTIFSSVFVHRYRDICSDIRSLCIQELGTWMKEYNKVFLSDVYLKYIGWTMSDKVSEVRLQSVLALIPLYSSSELAPHLELFTQKFKERLVSMRLDKEDSVQVATINLCGHLLTLDMLEPEECIEMCELVFMDTKKTVSQAAGAFASQYLFSEDFLSKERRSKPPKGRKKPTDAQIKIKELVRFFMEANIHEHTIYLVDSLWDHTDVLQDWESLVSILTDSSCGIVLSSEGESVLIDMITYAVKKASNTNPVKGKGKGISAKDRKAMAAGRESLGSILIPILPDLIAKYGTDARCAASLTSIPQYFDMEMYVEMRAQKHLEELLDHLKQLTLKHSTDEVLTEIACTYSRLLSPDVTLHSTVDVAFGQLIDELSANCKQSLEALKEESCADENDDDVYNLGVNLKRFTALFKQVNLTRWSFVDELLRIIELGIDGNAADMVVIPSLTSIHLHLLWNLHDLDEANPERSTMRTIKLLTDKLVKHCHDLMKLGSPDTQKQAYSLLCDLLVVFSKQLKTRGPLGRLVHSPDPLLQSTMCDYVMEKVFKEAEEDIEPTNDEEAYAYAEKLNDRRVLLAGILKLLMFSVIELNVGVPIFGQYVKFASDYGDLIKKALSHIRECSPIKWYKTVLHTLHHQYTILQEEGEGLVDHRSAEWADLKDLARRVALTTGFDLVKWRLPIVCIHRDGIRFALQDYDNSEEITLPHQLDFLEVLSEFSFRLLPIDRSGEKGILPFLISQLGEGVIDKVKGKDDWKSLKIYLTSLEKTPGGGGGGAAEDNEVVNTVPSKKGGRGESKRKQQVDKEKSPAANKIPRLLEAAED